MTGSDALLAALRRAGQERMAGHLETLDPHLRADLLRDLASVDLAWLAAQLDSPAGLAAAAPGSLEPLPAIERGLDPRRDREALDLGAERLAAGKVAALLVAGGQGSRLGHPGPKGTFPATPVKGKPLFQVFAEKLRKIGRDYGAVPPLLVMTSPGNHDETREFFESRSRFGLPEDGVRFFVQGTLPAIDLEGRLILAGPSSLFRSPDGHGGSLLALRRSGLLQWLADRRIEDIFYFQVDNPLVRVCDPWFLGCHRLAGSQFTSKAVAKRNAGEKVGVFVRKDGRPAVIEYSDLPAPLREEEDGDGRLRFRAGNIAVHVLDRAFVEDLTRGGRLSLPFHRARKRIPCWDPEAGPAEVEGIKFESFVFDALPYASAATVVLVERCQEFSPIKNPSGEDSPESCLRDQALLFAGWLDAAGHPVPRDRAGLPLRRIEIGPLFADGPADLRRHALGDLPAAGDLVLDAI